MLIHRLEAYPIINKKCKGKKRLLFTFAFKNYSPKVG